MSQATPDLWKSPRAVARAGWLAGIVVVATWGCAFAQDLSSRGSNQDGAHPVSGSSAVQPRGVDGAGARSAESETSRTPASLADGGEGAIAGAASELLLLLREEAEQGDADAQYALGLMYATGMGVLRDDGEAVLWYRKAAEQGNAMAQLDLGFMYSNGEGVPKDDGEAVLWYRKAAEQGNAMAQFNLGLHYANGEGVPKDDREAVLWYRKAAEQGDASARLNLGFMYSNGEGVPKDDGEAMLWYRKAAEQGNAMAQFNLGLRYANGEGVPKDDVQAYAWANLAAAQGDESARELRAGLSGYMTQAQIAEAQKLSRELAERVAAMAAEQQML